MLSTPKEKIYCLAFLGMTIIGLFIYASSFASIFIFDDHPNLVKINNVSSIASGVDYVFNNSAGMRPVSYLSFLLQKDAWHQQHSFDFKLVNFIIHTLNSFLIFLILSRTIFKKQPALAFFSCFIWYIHPIHINTVLYTVQRMTLLSALFSLLAIWQYTLLKESKNINHFLFFILLLALSIFSKENGYLTLCFISCIYYTTSTENSQTGYRKELFIALVSVFSLFIFLALSGKIFSGYQFRDFSLTDRLLTQPAILVEYIEKIILPTPTKYSLFHDNYPIIKTIYSLDFFIPTAILTCLLSLAFILREKFPTVFFGICFFFCGHILESTIIPLELYFDHRNYLPSLGIIVTSLSLISIAYKKINSRFIRLISIISALCITLIFLYTSKIESSNWNNDFKLISSFIDDNPNSKRSLLELSELYLEHNDPHKSFLVLQEIERKFGRTTSLTIKQLAFKCSSKKFTELIDDIKNKKTNYEKDVSGAMSFLKESVYNDNCTGISKKQYRQLLRLLYNESKHPKDTHNLAYLLMNSYPEDEPLQALTASMILPLKKRRTDYLYQQMILSFKAGNLSVTQELYNEFKKRSLFSRLKYKDSIKSLEKFMEENHAKNSTGSEN